MIRGCALHQCVGRRFSLGSVILYGLAPHLTCASPQPIQQDACAALIGTALWAQILTEGDVTLGDQLRVLDEADRTPTER